MSKNLKDMLNNIAIPDELDESIDLGFKRGKKEKIKFRKSLLALAASLTIIISSLSIIGFDKVEAAIKNVLQYIPGYNILIDTDEGHVFALEDQILYEDHGVYVRIKAVSKLGKNLSINLESNYGPIDTKGLLLKDKGGNLYPPITWSRGHGGDFWQGDYYYEVKEEDKEYSLVLGDMEIPFTLDKSKEVEDFYKLGNYASDKGIDIVAIKKPLKDKLRISLLNQSQDKYLSDYPFKDNLWGINWHGQALDIEDSMYILNKSGEKFYPDIPSSFGGLMSDFYFNIEDEEGLQLVLPYVKVQYPQLTSDKIRIKTPKDGQSQSIDKLVDFGRFEIKIMDVRLEDNDIIVRLKSSSLKDEILESLSIRGLAGYGLVTNTDSGYVELYIDKKDVGRSFKFSFQAPTTILLGNWHIDLD